VSQGPEPRLAGGRTKTGSTKAPTQDSPGPLAGLRVLDVSQVLAGPIAGQLLADFGAEVVKIEHPKKPDGLRELGPAKDGEPLWWKVVSRNKKTVAIDLSDPLGASLLADLAKGSDVLIENFRPGTMESWGLGYESLSASNPGLVMLRISGFGQSGPYARRPAFGTLIEAMSGFAAATGEPEGPPTLPPLGLADTLAGISGALAVMMALYYRDAKGGTGQDIDLSILEPLVSVMSPQPTELDQLGRLPGRIGNRSELNAPRNLYRTRDGRWVAMSTSTTAIAERVMRTVGHGEIVDEEWFATSRGRVAHADLLDSMVAEWIAERDRDEVIAAFEAAEAAVGPVYSVAELMADPHAVARGVFAKVHDPRLGEVAMPGLLFRMSQTTGAIRFTGRGLGADTDEVLRNYLGMGDEEIAALRRRGVIC